MKNYRHTNNFIKRVLGIAVLIIVFSAMLFGCFPIKENTPNPVKLQTPLLPRFDSDNLTLSWRPVENAKNYNVTLCLEHGGETIIDTNTQETAITFDNNLFVGKTGFFYFYVKALAHGNYSESEQTEAWWYRTLKALSNVEQLSFDRESGSLSWTEVENADFYIINYSYTGMEEIVEATNNSYDFYDMFKDITPVTFKVFAGTNDIDSAPSETATVKSFIVLDAPSGITYSGGTLGNLTWDNVPNATSYEFYYEHTYRQSNGNIITNRNPSSASSTEYITVYEPIYKVFLYTNLPVVNATFWVRAVATGYQSSSFVKYSYSFS